MAHDGSVTVSTKIDNRELKKGLAQTEREIKKLSDAFNAQNKIIREQESLISDLEKKYHEAAQAAKEIEPLDPAKLETLKTTADEAFNSYIAQKEKLDELLGSANQAISEARYTASEAVKAEEEALRNSTEENMRKAEALRETANAAQLAADAALAHHKALMDRTPEHVIDAMKNITEELGDQWSKAAREYTEYRNSISGAQSEINAEMRGIANEIDNAMAKLQEAETGAREISANLSTAKNEAKLFHDELARLAPENVNTTAASATRLKSALGGIATAAGVIGTATVKAFGMMRTAISSVISSARALARLIMGSFRTMGSAIARVARITAGLARGLFNAARNVLTLGRNTQRTGRSMSMFGRQLRRVALMGTVFMVLRRGLTSLTQGLGSALMANKQFAESWNTVKINMLTAMAPILDVVIPAFTRLMQILTRITALLAQFMATLFGVSVSQARQSARGYGAAADAIGGVGGAAKDASKHLASFDEINQAAAEGGGGSGGGSGGMDFDIPIAESVGWIDELAERISNFFRVADFDGWFTLGAIAADKFTDALNRIPWRRLRQGARTAGVNMAGLLSGFFSNVEMWEAVGYTIAQGFNTALDYLESFASRFLWRDVGRAISSGINTFIHTFDWQLAARTFNAWALGILNLLQDAIQAVHWWSLGSRLAEMLNAIQWRQIFDALGETLAEALNAMARTLSAFARNFDWREFGSAIASGINTFFTNWNAREAADAINAIALGLLDMIRAAIDKIDMPLIESSLRTFIGSIKWKEIISGTISVIGDIKLGFLNLLLAAVDEIPWTEIGEGIRDGIGTIPWDEVLGTAIDLIGSVTTGLLQMLLSATEGMTPERMQEIGGEVAAKLRELPWKEILRDAGQLVGRLILGFLSFLQGIIEETDWEQVGKDIATFLESEDWGEILRETGRLMIAAIAAAMKIFAELPSSWQTVIRVMVGALGAALITKTVMWVNKIKLFLAGPKILAAATKAGGTVGSTFAASTAAAASSSTAKTLAATAGNKFAKAFGVGAGIMSAWYFTHENQRELIANQNAIMDVYEKHGEDAARAYADGLMEENAQMQGWLTATFGDAWKPSFLRMEQDATEAGASMGENLMRSMADGTSRFPVIEFFRNLFRRDVIGTAEDELEIGSPSKVFMRIAEFCVAGFTRGFDGIADKAATIFSNVWSGIQGVFSNTQTWFGDTFTAAKDAVSNAWSAVGGWFSDRWSDIQNAFRNTGTWFRNTFNTARTSVNNVWQTVGTWFGDRWTNIRTAFSNTGEWFRSTFNTARTNVNNIWSNVGTWFSDRWANIQNAFSNTASWFSTRFNEARTSMEGSFDSTRVTNWFNDRWTNIQSAFANVSSWFSTRFTQGRTSMEGAFGANTISNFFGGVWGTIQGAFSDASSWFSGIGTSMMDGLRGGVQSAASAVANAATSVVQGAVDGARRLLNISSPSKLMHDLIGLNMGYGIAEGLIDSASYIFKALRGTLSGLQDSAEKFSFVSLGRDMAFDMLDGMKQAYNPIIDFFKSLMDRVDTIVSTPIEIPRIPQLSGNIVDSATISMMVEKGRVSSPPRLDDNREWIRSILDRLESIENAIGDIKIEGGTINVNGREFARITYDDFEAEAKRRGFRISGNELGFVR